MASVREIETFHRTLAGQMRVLTSMHVSIRSAAENWQRMIRNSKISFDMFRRLPHGAAGKYSTATGIRKRGGRCPVIPLNRDSVSLEDQAWAAWHEEWHCERLGSFDLIGAGWTFFWGTDGRLGRDQEILRAEWDQVPDREDQRHRRGGFAAQPHWHLDTGMMAGYARPILREPPTNDAMELEEISSADESDLEEIGRPSGIQELDLSAMHLGMGGWLNDNDHPRCWQKQVTESPSELVLWAVRTLQSARDQFRDLRINEIAG